MLSGFGSGAAAKKTFTMNAFRVMITYTYNGCDKERILKNAKGLLPDATCIVAEEQYQEGGTHFHVYIETQTRTKYSTSLITSIGSISGHIVEVKIRPQQMIAYVCKDDNYVFYPVGTEYTIAMACKSYAHVRNMLEESSFKPKNFKGQNPWPTAKSQTTLVKAYLAREHTVEQKKAAAALYGAAPLAYGR